MCALRIGLNIWGWSWIRTYKSCNSHVHCQKAHARLKFMYRHRNSLGKMSRQLLSSVLIQPHFDYAATSWYMGSTEHLKHKLQVTQNKVVRFILNKPPRQHIGQNELDMVNLLNTEHRVKQLMMIHMKEGRKEHIYLTKRQYNTYL